MRRAACSPLVIELVDPPARIPSCGAGASSPLPYFQNNVDLLVSRTLTRDVVVYLQPYHRICVRTVTAQECAATASFRFRRIGIARRFHDLRGFYGFANALLDFGEQIFAQTFGNDAGRGQFAQIGDGKLGEIAEDGGERGTGMADAREAHVVGVGPLAMLRDGLDDAEGKAVARQSL